MVYLWLIRGLTVGSLATVDYERCKTATGVVLLDLQPGFEGVLNRVLSHPLFKITIK